MDEVMANDLTGLDSIAIHVLRRLGKGQVVDVLVGRSTDFGSYQRAHDALIARALVEIKSTPKGKRKWYELTEAGRSLLPLIEKADKDQEAKERRCRLDEDSRERVRNAAPELLDALKRMVVAYRDGCDDADQPDSIKAALAAIAKAEGRS